MFIHRVAECHRWYSQRRVVRNVLGLSTTPTNFLPTLLLRSAICLRDTQPLRTMPRESSDRCTVPFHSSTLCGVKKSLFRQKHSAFFSRLERGQRFARFNYGRGKLFKIDFSLSSFGRPSLQVRIEGRSKLKRAEREKLAMNNCAFIYQIQSVRYEIWETARAPRFSCLYRSNG